MECKIFYGTAYELEHQFNKWAKGKALTDKLKIHVIAMPAKVTMPAIDFAWIIIFYPENSQYDDEKEVKQHG